ncbi:MAG: DUF5335 family protein [Gemmatimonadetes bacterium]|nr:DUF5335 family protein [Gemmatimonadota bacterium]
MAETTRIPQERLAQYFDDFTKRVLRDPSPEAADVELVSTEWGDQTVASGARLLGITYDRHRSSLEFAFDTGDHRVDHPKEVWVLEEDDGFVSSVEVVRADGDREVVRIQHVGLRRLE